MTWSNIRTNYSLIPNRKVVASLVLATAATLSLAIAPAYAKSCKSHSHSGFATGVLTEAKSAAKMSWANRVAQHEGGTWASWSQATNKKLSCVDGDTSLFQKRCTVTAMACKSVFSPKKRIPFVVRGS